MVKHSATTSSSSMVSHSIETLPLKLPQDMMYLFKDFKILLISIKAMKEQIYCGLKSKEDFINEVDSCIQSLSDKTIEHCLNSRNCLKSYTHSLCERFIQSAMMIDIHRLHQKLIVLTIPRFIAR